ncbi:S8 family peptidase [Mycobacterium sp.]|uniref:S8 family peptidase n=1 Tax=Mycobacterium sp. TaxID=1785 RepID=UPI002C02BF44|nr:S8 family peptidase [Mycobacterium sp.]HME50117.1 S8 family peptidase [Mycobacterium sp.]
MTSPPARGPRRTSIVSPLVLGDSDNAPPGAAQMVLTDEQNRRVVLVELRLGPGADPAAVRRDFLAFFEEVFRGADAPPPPVTVARHYMRCVLTPDEITQLVRGGQSPTDASTRRGLELIYHVWPDMVIHAHLDRSLSTIKADAAAHAFRCGGSGVVWAILDSGIDENHPHFAAHNTLRADAVKKLHRDFTIPSSAGAARSPLTDGYGHGTHVAGIIAGEAPHDEKAMRIAYNEPTAQDLPQWALRTLPAGATLSGVAPKANLVSLKVLDGNGNTLSSVVLEAIDYVRTVNSDGRDLRIHGVNLSFGCPWPATEYAAGQSPLCRELDLLVGSGVIAVVSAGNAGAGGTIEGVGNDVYGQLSTITDPGNAATAITVGSVHRYRPHTYGVTFSSSKGPTLDGRRKPDLVAPGERITSAATGQLIEGVPPLQPAAEDPAHVARYREDSGTSMSAAHVSGAIAAFLSVRSEYVGQPQLVKQLFLDTASDLGRHEFYQGAGLIDLMRALSAT